MTTKAEQEKIIRAQEQTIKNLQAQIASMQRGTTDIGAQLKSSLSTIMWEDRRTGASDDTGQELHEYHNFGPMIVLKRVALAYGEQRVRAEEIMKPLEAKYEKLSRVFDADELNDVWSKREERALKRSTAQWEQLVGTENSILAAIETLDCPQWNREEYYKYIAERAHERNSKRENDRAVEAS